MKRDEFLAGRKAGIGGSDIGAIIGVSKFKTAVDVWMDKTGRSKPSDSTIPQRFGIFAEEFVAQEYTLKTGRRVVRHNAQLIHPQHSFLIGNVDRLVIPEGEKIAAYQGQIRTDRGMEAKCVSAFGASEWGDDESDEVPPYYLTQCAWYRILTGCIYWDLAALIGNSRVEVYTLPSDTELEELLVARAVEFWQNHVLTDIPPAPQSAHDIALLYPKSEEGRKAVADAETKALIQDVAALRKAAKANEALEEAKLVKIKDLAKDADLIVDIDGNPLATWKSNKDSVKIDYETAYKMAIAQVEREKMEALHKEIIAQNTTVKNGARPFKIK